MNIFAYGCHHNMDPARRGLERVFPYAHTHILTLNCNKTVTTL
jgi:hypothetical protein